MKLLKQDNLILTSTNIYSDIIPDIIGVSVPIHQDFKLFKGCEDIKVEITIDYNGQFYYHQRNLYYYEDVIPITFPECYYLPVGLNISVRVNYFI